MNSNGVALVAAVVGLVAGVMTGSRFKDHTTQRVVGVVVTVGVAFVIILAGTK
jgi:hypothetical protein